MLFGLRLNKISRKFTARNLIRVKTYKFGTEVVARGNLGGGVYFARAWWMMYISGFYIYSQGFFAEEKSY